MAEEEGFGVPLDLIDRMSGPAAEIKAQLRGVADSMLRLREIRLDAKMRGDAEAVKAAGMSLEWLALDAEKAREQLKRLGDTPPPKPVAPEAKGLGIGSLIPEIAVAELAVHAIEKIGAAAVATARAIADATVEFGRFVLEASEMRENAIDAFKVFEPMMGRMAMTGEEAFGAIQSIAVATHTEIGRAMGLSQALMAQGMTDIRNVTAAVAAISSLSRAGPAGSADRLQRIIEKSLATGQFKLTGKELRGSGLNADVVAARIAEQLHTSVATIKSELKGGQIAAGVGIKAILDEINTGKIGELAREKLTLGDVATDFQNTFTQMVDSVNVRPIVEALEDVIWVLNGGKDGSIQFKDSLKSALDVLAEDVAWAIDQALIGFLKLEIWYIKNETRFSAMWDELKKSMASIDWAGMVPKIETVGTALEIVARSIVTIAKFGAVAVNALSWVGHTASTLASGAVQGVAAAAASGAVPGVPAAAMAPVGPPAAASAMAPVGPPAAASGAVPGVPAAAMAPVGPLRPNRAGGTVLEPAPGETIASVAPGERIVPPGAFEPQSTGRTVHVDVGGIHITIQGHADESLQRRIEELSEHAIQDVFERVALEMGS